MIIQCESCSRKFIVKDNDIPKKGRTVKCGYCSMTWHQMPIIEKQTKQVIKDDINEDLSVEKIKASDGKTYKFLGSQWVQLFPSGKTGLFAKKKIGNELDKLTGRKKDKSDEKKIKTKKILNPSSESLEIENKLPDLYTPKKGLGFFGYIFLFIVICLSFLGVIKTFENYLINSFPETEYLFLLLDEQLTYVYETLINMFVLFTDLINSY